MCSESSIVAVSSSRDAKTAPPPQQHFKLVDDVVFLWPNSSPKSFFDARDIRFTHIPKTGGTAIVHMMNSVLQNSKFADQQECYNSMRRDGTVNAVLFRSPPSHIVSQFLYCYESPGWPDRVTRNKGFPRTGNATRDFAT